MQKYLDCVFVFDDQALSEMTGASLTKLGTGAANQKHIVGHVSTTIYGQKS